MFKDKAKTAALREQMEDVMVKRGRTIFLIVSKEKQQHFSIM